MWWDAGMVIYLARSANDDGPADATEGTAERVLKWYAKLGDLEEKVSSGLQVSVCLPVCTV